MIKLVFTLKCSTIGSSEGESGRVYNNRSAALAKSICWAIPTIYLLHSDMLIIPSDNFESYQGESLS